MKIDLEDVFITPFKILSEKWTIAVPIIIALALQLIFDVSIKSTVGGLWKYGAWASLAQIILKIIIFFLLAWQTVLFRKFEGEGEEEDLNESFSEVSKKVIDVIITAIVVGFLIGIGTLAFVIPGLILAILLVYSPSAIVVKNLGVSEAIKESFDFTFKRGNLVQTIILLIIIFVFSFIPIVGSYFSTFLLMLWIPYAYVKFSEE